LATSPAPTSATTARIADLHDRVARGEQRLAEVRHRVREIEREQIDAGDVAAAFSDFDNVWNALSSREQAHVISLLVSRVEFDVSDSTVAISFYPTAIKVLADASEEHAA
jgi:site-specific DNA recombinase